MSETKRDEPVATIQHTADEWAASTDRVPVFTVTRNATEGEGDERAEPELVTYTMPRKPNVGLALRYLRMARKQSPDVAMSWLIEEAIGEEGYDALAEELASMGEDGKTLLKTIAEKVQTIAAGGLESPKAG
jgi:hypothetical protein